MSGMPYSDEDFEELAKIVRTDVNLDDQIQLDAVEFLRRLKRQGYIADYVRVPDLSMLDAEAKFIQGQRKILLRESIFAGAENWDPHCRFTIVHECAHALLNHQFERKRSFTAQAFAEKKVASIGRDENEADRLGAAILSPFHQSNFSLDSTVNQIMQRFGLSKPAAILRHEALSRIYRRQYNLTRPLPQGVVDFLAQKRREGHK
jgi:Zn-dependent peptidase ImmA (M78 family)